jgi:hypothetical protein
MNEAQCSIQLIARITGWSACVIRIWEQRYRDTLEKVGATPIENLAQPGATLDGLRQPARKAIR